MSHPTKYCHDTNYGPDTAQRPSFCECDHGDDLIYTFGLPFYNGKLNFDVKFTDNERTLSREWMKYIVNFAANGWVQLKQVDLNLNSLKEESGKNIS